jgi:hypothetical protein
LEGHESKTDTNEENPYGFHGMLPTLQERERLAQETLATTSTLSPSSPSSPFWYNTETFKHEDIVSKKLFKQFSPNPDAL